MNDIAWEVIFSMSCLMSFLFVDGFPPRSSPL
jgi:hypothetical protein